MVDWELSTLGDPLSDAALMCVYRDPALDLIVHAQAAWTSPLLPAADELADRHSEIVRATGTGVSPSAATTLYSRAMSCADGVSPCRGGRRTNQLDASS